MPGCREREVPKCGCPGGKGFANEAILASRVRKSECPNRSAWGNRRPRHGRTALRSRLTWSDGERNDGRDGDDSGRLRSDPRPDDRHRGATARATHRWPLFARWLEAAGIELQQAVQQGDQALAVGVQGAEIARAAKALGQQVPGNPPEELSTRERALFRLAGFSAAIAEAHPTIRAGEDALFTDNAAVAVRTARRRRGSPPPVVIPPLSCLQHRWRIWTELDFQ